MEQPNKVIDLLARTFHQLRQRRIQRRLDFSDAALSRIFGTGEREAPYIFEDSDEESTFGTTTGQPDPSYQVLLEGARFAIGSFIGEPTSVLLLFEKLLRRLLSIEEKVAFLQRVIEWGQGETDQETDSDLSDEELN